MVDWVSPWSWRQNYDLYKQSREIVRSLQVVYSPLKGLLSHPLTCCKLHSVVRSAFPESWYIFPSLVYEFWNGISSCTNKDRIPTYLWAWRFSSWRLVVAGLLSGLGPRRFVGRQARLKYQHTRYSTELRLWYLDLILGRTVQYHAEVQVPAYKMMTWKRSNVLYRGLALIYLKKQHSTNILQILEWSS